MWVGVDLVKLSLVCFLLFSLTKGVSNDTIHVLTTPEGPVNEGATVQMMCEAKGYPPPKYVWGKMLENGTVVWSNRSWTTGPFMGSQPNCQAITLQKVNKGTHGGVYVCVAQNTANNKTYMAMTTIKLIVVPNEFDFRRHTNPILWSKTISINEGDEGLGIFSYVIPTLAVGVLLVIGTVVAHKIMVPSRATKAASASETGETDDQSPSATFAGAPMPNKRTSA